MCRELDTLSVARERDAGPAQRKVRAMNTPRARALLGSLALVVADFVEPTNNGAASVDIGGYVIKDSDDGHYVADVDSGPGGFGLGKADSARLPRSTG